MTMSMTTQRIKDNETINRKDRMDINNILQEMVDMRKKITNLEERISILESNEEE